MKFKIGDKVKLRKDSFFYRSQNEYSQGTFGVIINLYISDMYPIAVAWEGTNRFAYNESDLEFWGYPINDLNKLLYPDYVERDGLLVPKNI
jgi:hypothetical protein